MGWNVESYFVECGECGVSYGISQHLWNSRAKDGGAVHCPNGHRRFPSAPDELIKTRSERDKAIQDRDLWRKWHDDRGDEIARLGRVINALRGHVGRLKREAARRAKP
jgi:predicted RNA-binding protein YlqC (UPF0109 family)